MRKRLRKKQRLGEFVEHVFAFRLHLPDECTEAQAEDLTDRLTAYAEEHGLGLFTTATRTAFEGMLTSGDPRGTLDQGHLDTFRAWVMRQKDLSGIELSRLFDGWYPPRDEFKGSEKVGHLPKRARA